MQQIRSLPVNIFKEWTIIYQDYRDYINSLIETKRKGHRKFSYQLFANKVGCSKSYLKQVVDKKRHVSIEKAFDIFTYFKVSTFDKQFYIFKILEETSKNSQAQMFFKNIVKTYQNTPSNTIHYLEQQKPLAQDMINSDWISMAIASLLEVPDHKYEARWFQKCLGGERIASLGAIKKAMKTIEKSGKFIQQTPGKWLPTQSNFIENPAPWRPDTFQMFVTGLKRAAISMQESHTTDLHNPCRYHMYSFAVSHENYKKMISCYDDFQQKIIEIAKQNQIKETVVFLSNNAIRIAESSDAN